MKINCEAQSFCSLSVIFGSVHGRPGSRTGVTRNSKDDAEFVAAASSRSRNKGKEELTYKLVSVEHAEQQVVAA